MRIHVLGGGPGGLYLAILLKRSDPSREVVVVERNAPDDTFGWGVVFSDETLSNLEEADAPTYDAISKGFARWNDIDVHVGDRTIRSTGHGFCGIARKELLRILQTRVRALGVELAFKREIDDVEAFRKDADLLVGADGLKSAVRARYESAFGPSLDVRKCRFIWLGTTQRFSAFTFAFRENEHGLFQIHAYQFDGQHGTVIVETNEDAWRAAGLDRATEAESIAYCEKVFARELDGHPLLPNRSAWIQFTTVKNEHWSHQNVVLLGDAVHTAHFSIGSGTKLAMEDAIELAKALDEHPGHLPAALAAYEAARKPVVGRIQTAAQQSLEWFESAARHHRALDPETFVLSLMTRSRRITHANLGVRDPHLVAHADASFAARAESAAQGAGAGVREGAAADPRDSAGAGSRQGAGASVGPSRAGASAAQEPSAVRRTPPPMFTPLRLRGLTLSNRVVVSPMCMYSSEDGMPNDWHLVHLGSRAVGGAGLVMTEMTDVTPDGRITLGCAGIYSDAHATAWKRIVDFVHTRSHAKIGMQLAHAGRKGSCELPWVAPGDPPLRDARAWETLGPSALPFDAKIGSPPPREMTRADMIAVRDAFVAGATRALAAGFDLLELHYAHGYLLSSFLSPISNRRTDEHGGSLENRMRFPLEVFDAVRAAWPAERPLGVRVSATDWVDGAFTDADAVVVARALHEHGCDFIDVSSGGTSPDQKPVYGRMFQTPFSDRIRNEVGIKTIAVGNIQDYDQINTILVSGRADLCALARPHLFDPYLTLHAAAAQDWDVPWPDPYLLAKPKPRA